MERVYTKLRKRFLKYLDKICYVCDRIIGKRSRQYIGQDK